MQILLHYEAKKFPRKKLLLMLIFLVLILLINLMRGESGSSIINIKRCSTAFWLLTACIPVVTGLFIFIILKIIFAEIAFKKEIGY